MGRRVVGVEKVLLVHSNIPNLKPVTFQQCCDIPVGIQYLGGCNMPGPYA